MRHNVLRDMERKFMEEVCKDLQIEPISDRRHNE